MLVALLVNLTVIWHCKSYNGISNKNLPYIPSFAMKALIIDDEQNARHLLQFLLEQNCPEIKSIELAENLSQGVELINNKSPDIVFLDIEMPGYSGLQLLDFIPTERVTFELIFTTGYSKHAIKAFELNAIDYLLKPLRDEQVENAVKKAIKQIGHSKVGERLEELKKAFKASNINKIGLPVADGILFVGFDDIIMLEADRMYTKVFTENQEMILVSKPLKFFIDALQGSAQFYKPHRSYIINLKRIKQYVNKDGGYIVMDNQKTVSISREKREEFFELLGSN
jgi:two-component system LytT family response regulator